MMSKKVLFVLGAMNAETDMVKRLLAAVGMPYSIATKDGKFVASPSEAQKADGISKAPEKGQLVAFVECNVKGYDPIKVFGSLGNELGSPEFYFGSSVIGQLISALIGNPNFGGGREAAAKLEPLLWEARLAAVSDQHLSDAYRGLCPGVDPSALRLWRAMRRSEARDVLNQYDEALAALKGCDLIHLGAGLTVRSVDKYIAEMYEAAAISGECIMYSRGDRKAGKTKVTLINASASEIGAWLEWARSSGGLVDVYGSPEKGYAGGFKN